MTTLATICARGGSEGLPGKNIRDLRGKPLIAWTIEQALAAPGLDRVVVSTDAAEIAEVARAWGAEVPALRPPELATATASKLDAIAHCVAQMEAADLRFDRIVDLDPTSPLRSLDDIAAALALLDDQSDCVITAYLAEKNPYFNMVEIGADGIARLSKPPPHMIAGRQGAPPVYAMNASIYVWHRATFDKGLWNGRTRLHVMPRERSIDIDSLIDFRLVELLLGERP